MDWLPIIYVEDSPQDAEHLTRAFQQTPVPNELIVLQTADATQTYFQALAARSAPAPAVALIDLTLPSMPGLDLITWIREQSTLSRMPIVALASQYVFEDLERSYSSGANLYLLKPKALNEWTDLVFRLQGYWATQSMNQSRDL